MLDIASMILCRSVIDRYKLKKYHLVAHSMGCTIALALAGHDPSAVRSVSIISPVRIYCQYLRLGSLINNFHGLKA